jgi:hypothetical protein
LKNHFKYWTFVLVFCYGLTVGVQYLLRPLWFIKSEEHTGLAMFETVLTIFILPVALVTTVYWVTKKFDKKNWFLLSGVIICSCIYISAQLDFLNWADSIGSRQHPDNETLMIVALEWQAGLVVTAVGLIICLVRLYWKRKKISS